MSKHPEAQFLHQQNPNLHHSTEVEAVADYLRAGSEQIPNQPDAKIAAYLGFLADVANDGILTGDQTSIDRQVDAHIVAAEALGDAFFRARSKGEAETAKNRGQLMGLTEEGFAEQTYNAYGQYNPQTGKTNREEAIEAVQTDQRASLTKWVEYLGGDDGAYPDWLKTYAWNSVIKLGGYDKSKGRFNQRTDSTAAAYPDLNREALAYVFDNLNKHRVQGQTLDTEDEKLEKLLKGANFGKLYAHALAEIGEANPELLTSIEGKWVKFDQTSDPRTARRLSESLQGHGTGWCTAGESTAAGQLQNGDFYVFYTGDEKGRHTVPRLAVRMEGGQVSHDVRGILPGQEVEPVLIDTLAEKLETLPGGEGYVKKAEDMRQVTNLQKLLDKDPNTELTKDQVKFLYEVGHSIESFGYDRDPRIDALKATRGEQDHGILKELAIEHIREHFAASYQAYVHTAELLGAPAKTEADLQELYTAKLAEWQRSGVLDYIGDRMIADGELHTPVITPEGLFDHQQLSRLAKSFGEQQPYETNVFDDLYSQYTAAELSGGGSMRISLLPTKPGQLFPATVDAQRQELVSLQANKPTLNFRVPSVLEALAYWHTLRASGDKLADDSAFDKTYIRHIDLEAKRLHRWLYVPRSCVYYDGQPLLVYSVAEEDRDARLAVG